MFGLPISWHSEGRERVGKKWGKYQGLIYPDLDRHREASGTSSTTEGRKVTGHYPRFPRLLLMGADHESLAGLESFRVTQELLPALMGSQSMESLGSPHWGLHRQGGGSLATCWFSGMWSGDCLWGHQSLAPVLQRSCYGTNSGPHEVIWSAVSLL